MTDITALLKTFSSAGSAFSKIKFGQGVVGKGTAVCTWGMLLFFGLGIIGYLMNDKVMIYISFILICACILFWMFKVLSFAERNPLEAVMEGTEYCQYGVAKLASKDLEFIENTPSVEPPTAGVAFKVEEINE